jgi:hypothetical protein
VPTTGKTFERMAAHLKWNQVLFYPWARDSGVNGAVAHHHAPGFHVQTHPRADLNVPEVATNSTLLSLHVAPSPRPPLPWVSSSPSHALVNKTPTAANPAESTPSSSLAAQVPLFVHLSRQLLRLPFHSRGFISADGGSRYFITWFPYARKLRGLVNVLQHSR